MSKIEMNQVAQSVTIVSDSRQIDRTATNLEETQHLKPMDTKRLDNMNTVNIAADKIAKNRILSCRPVLFICLVRLMMIT